MTDLMVLMWVLTASVMRALFRRAFNGPLQPSWSWKLEAVVGVQKGMYSMISRVGPERYNAVVQRILPPVPTGDARIEPSTAAALPGSWVVPPEESDIVILYLHGGGYVYGSLESHGAMICLLACKAAARTLVLDYRLAPQDPYPAALDDACVAYRHLVATGTSPQNIIIAGDSAGGGLLLALLVALRDAGDPLPAAGVAISPWVDLSCDDESFARNAPFDGVSREACRTCAVAYIGDDDVRNPLISPLYADLRGLPPLLVHAGEAEVLVDQIVKFSHVAEEAGVDVTLDVRAEMVHVWHMLGDFTPQGDLALDDIASYIRQATTY